jgi:phage terminase small subunit
MNNRQRVFVEEYLRCWNASEAARRAGYRGKPNVIGARLLADVSISAEISRRLAELKMGTDEVLVRLAEQARGTMADFLDVKGDRIDLAKAKRAKKLHLIKSFKHSVGKTETTSIELYDAQAALVHIGRAQKLFVDRTEFSADEDTQITITVIQAVKPDGT